MKKIIINAYGEDKPGIVSKISGLIHSFKGNIEISKMVQLETNFSILMLVEIPNNNFKNLSNSLEKLKELDIIINTTNKKPSINKSIKYTFSINVVDNEGIIFSYSDLFKKYNINIISMDTFLKNAPITGSPIFYMNSVIMVNKNIDLDVFKNDLKKLSNKNNVEFKLLKSK